MTFKFVKIALEASEAFQKKTKPLTAITGSGHIQILPSGGPLAGPLSNMSLADGVSYSEPHWKNDLLNKEYAFQGLTKVPFDLPKNVAFGAGTKEEAQAWAIGHYMGNAKCGIFMQQLSVAIFKDGSKALTVKIVGQPKFLEQFLKGAKSK